MSIAGDRCLLVPLEDVAVECLPDPAERERFLAFPMKRMDIDGHIAVLDQMKKRTRRNWVRIGRYHLLVAARNHDFNLYPLQHIMPHIEQAVAHLSNTSRGFVLACLLGGHYRLGTDTTKAKQYADMALRAVEFGGEGVQDLGGRVFMSCARVHAYMGMVDWRHGGNTLTPAQHREAALSLARRAVDFFASEDSLTQDSDRPLYLSLALSQLVTYLLEDGRLDDLAALLDRWVPALKDGPEFVTSYTLPFLQGVRLILHGQADAATAMLLAALSDLNLVVDHSEAGYLATGICAAIAHACRMTEKWGELLPVLNQREIDLACVESVSALLAVQRLRNQSKEG